LKETGKLIGCAGFVDLDLKNNNAEIGYWLGEKYWGKGIMSEAVFAIIKYGFDNLKLHKIYGKHISENINSKRIFEKLGFKEEGL
jgi:RimJ/RimL family protein N-acetyltransferase